jgi:hypothetical protein
LTLVHSKNKAVPVTDCGSPQFYETSRFSHFLGNRLTDGGEDIGLMRQPLFTRRKIPVRSRVDRRDVSMMEK